MNLSDTGRGGGRDEGREGEDRGIDMQRRERRGAREGERERRGRIHDCVFFFFKFIKKNLVGRTRILEPRGVIPRYSKPI